MGDPPYKASLSLLPGNLLLPKVAKSLPVSASVGCVGRRRRPSGGSACVGWQKEYVVGGGREECVGFNSGRFCRIYTAPLECIALSLRGPASWWVQCAVFPFKRKSIWIKGNSGHPAASIFFEQHRFIKQFFTFDKFTG